MTNNETYNYKVVRQFSIMTIVWGLVGMLVGVLIAAQLAWPVLNFDIPWLTFSRLRPLHTNAVIFAFGGCALFACSYYVVQHTCHAKLAFPALAAFTFWGWQAVILLAAITLPLGITTSKEYAELEWPIDILITLVWVSYALVFFGTIVKRRIPHIYVANWFFGAFIITVAVLHLFNSAALPVSFWKSYSAYAGVQDAMVQWWYGASCITSCPSRRDVRSTPTAYQSCISGRWYSPISGPDRTTCTSPRYRTGPSHSVWSCH
jgi:cytochrome c oxidase cbb3-type subunit 1